MNIQSVKIINDVEGTMEVTLSDGTGMSVPDDMANRHRRKIQAWIDAGNTPTPYVAPVPTWEDQIAESDRTLMPRWMEDHITSDHGGVAGNANLQAKYDQKVALRNSKPS